MGQFKVLLLEYSLLVCLSPGLGLLQHWLAFSAPFCLQVGFVGGAIYRESSPFQQTTNHDHPKDIYLCPQSRLNKSLTMYTSLDVNSPASPLPGYIPLYDVSYIWMTFIGFSIAFIVPIVLSFFMKQVVCHYFLFVDIQDKKLLSPLLSKMSWEEVGIDL